MTRCQPRKGTQRAGRCQANPGRAVRAGTPDAAVPVRGTPSWDAGTRPGLDAALGGRERYRSRPPRGEASWTSPHALCKPTQVRKRFLPRLRQLSSCGHYIFSLPRPPWAGHQARSREREPFPGKQFREKSHPQLWSALHGIGVRDPGSLRRRGRGSYDRGSRDQPRGPGHPGYGTAGNLRRPQEVPAAWSTRAGLIRSRFPRSGPQTRTSGGTGPPGACACADGPHTIAVPAIRPAGPDTRGVRDPWEA